MSDQQQTEGATQQEQQADRGQPANAQQSTVNQETDQDEDVGTYMSNLGAGTGVDIGPGAAGEMGGAAQEPNPSKSGTTTASHNTVEYPDSGDLPHLESP